MGLIINTNNYDCFVLFGQAIVLEVAEIWELMNASLHEAQLPWMSVNAANFIINNI